MTRWEDLEVTARDGDRWVSGGPVLPRLVAWLRSGLRSLLWRR